jgi:hypothetical protein
MVSVARIARGLALVLLTMAPVLAEQQNEAQTGSEQVRRQFDQVSREFNIGPYYRSDYDKQSQAYRVPYPSSPYPNVLRTFPYGPMRAPYSGGSVSGGSYPALRNPYAPQADRGDVGQNIPLPISREQRVTDLVLMAGVRALVYVVAIGLLAQMMPKRVWAQMLERNNTALAIVLAAIVLGLAIVIAAPLG